MYDPEIDPALEPLEVKAKAHRLLAELDVPVPDLILRLPAVDEVRPRSAKDVAGRLYAIGYLVGLGHGSDLVAVKALLDKYGLWPWVARSERGWFRARGMTDQERSGATWLVECAQALAWCLGMVDLDHRRHCDDDLLHAVPVHVDPHPFLSAARLRPLAEVQVQLDLHLRLHWYATDRRLAGKACGYEPGPVTERRRALEWVYGTFLDWDDVQLNT